MTAVKPIPEGFHTVTPHLIVRDAAQAIEFYKRAFGAVEVERSLGPDGKTIMHASIKIGDSILMLNDEFPQMGALSPLGVGGTSVTLHIYVEDVDALAKRATEAGATVVMPVADMFWGDRFGMFKDPYGHSWSIATHKHEPTAEEMAKAMEKACSQQH